MQISANLIHFFISYSVAFLAFGLIAKWYVWPNIKGRSLKVALSPLLLYACLRVNGLMFVMPGIVSPELPDGFAVPTAYGDLTAVVLALSRTCKRSDGELFGGSDGLALQYRGLFGSGLCQRRNIQRSCRPLSRGCERPRYDGHSHHDLRLFAEPTLSGVGLIVRARDRTTESVMNRTRLSLHYLYGYLIVGGLVLLFFPKEGLRGLLSNGDYGNVMPRFAGMLMAGLGMSIFGIVRARSRGALSENSDDPRVFPNMHCCLLRDDPRSIFPGTACCRRVRICLDSAQLFEREEVKA
jgi:hypothetical protein